MRENLVTVEAIITPVRFVCLDARNADAVNKMFQKSLPSDYNEHPQTINKNEVSIISVLII